MVEYFMIIMYLHGKVGFYNEVRWSVKREYQMFEANKAGFNWKWWDFLMVLSGTHYGMLLRIQW